MTRRFATASIFVTMLTLAYAQPAAAQIEPPEIVLAFPTVNPCNGEPVAIEGFIDLDTHAVEDSATGTHFQLHILSKGQGFSADDPATNLQDPVTKYVYSQELNFEFNGGGPSNAEEATQTLNHLLTSATATENFYLKMTIHVTLVNGAPTAEVEHIDTDCRGGE